MENSAAKNTNSNRAGALVQNLSGELEYFSFKPSPLPPEPTVQIDSQMLSLLIEANRKVAYLDAISEKIPNQNLFLSMYIRKEALVSSQIEGTQCTLDDVLDPNVSENSNIDVGEVINYIKASDYAITRLNDLPLCMRLLKETHAELIKGVRGSDKTPGVFRTSQNWIGGQGSTLKNARLSEVRKKGNYEQWILFFLQMILETANDAIDSINVLESLHKKNIALLEAVPARTRDNALKLFEYVERKAIIDTSKTAQELNLSYNTTAKNIELLCSMKILSPSAKNGKASLFSYTDYLDVLRKGTELEVEGKT